MYIVILYRPHLDLTKCNWKKKWKRVNRYNNSIQYRPHLDLRKCKLKENNKKKNICKYITLIVFGLIINRFTYD